MASLEPNYPFFALGIFKLEMAYFFIYDVIYRCDISMNVDNKRFKVIFKYILYIKYQYDTFMTY